MDGAEGAGDVGAPAALPPGAALGPLLGACECGIGNGEAVRRPGDANIGPRRRLAPLSMFRCFLLRAASFFWALRCVCEPRATRRRFLDGVVPTHTRMRYGT